MIENRMRLEREIIRGRQTIRKVTRSTTESKNAEQSPSNKDAKAFLKPSDALPIESEAEQEFAEGSQRFFKKPRGSSRTNLLRAAACQSTVVDDKQNDTTAQFPRARKAGSGDEAEEHQVRQAEASHPGIVGGDGQNVFIRAWRTRSFPAIPSPFRSRQAQPVRLSSGTDPEGRPWQSDDYWSSDSSSDIEFVG